MNNDTYILLDAILNRLVEINNLINNQPSRMTFAWYAILVAGITVSGALIATWLTHRFHLNREIIKSNTSRIFHEEDILRGKLEEAHTLLSVINNHIMKAININNRDDALRYYDEIVINTDLPRLGTILNLYFPSCVDALEEATNSHVDFFNTISIFWHQHDQNTPSSPAFNDIIHPDCERWDLALLNLIRTIETEAQKLRPIIE